MQQFVIIYYIKLMTVDKNLRIYHFIIFKTILLDLPTITIIIIARQKFIKLLSFIINA